ncbi:MAG: MBL fold metallo-hydrolase [Nanoarchaeota archaeon]|nr:MBL fold metallo-hydrolase [Nanoarchaeota archaeon]
MAMRSPTFTSLGGGDEIGASAHLYRFPAPRHPNGSINVLVDDGVRPRDRSRPNFEGVSHIDHVLLTHAHDDHIGDAPHTFIERPNAKFYMTQPGTELSRTGWDESARNMERAEENEGIPALFKSHHVDALVKNMRIITPWRRIELAEGLSVLPIHPGHLLGACSFLFDYQNGKNTILHTGDFSTHDQILIPGADTLKLRRGVDAIVSESTYLGSPSPDREKEKKSFLEAILAVLARNGVVLVPCFKMQRIQEVWEILIRAGIPRHLIVFDGNAEGIFDIFSRYTNITMPARNQFIRSHHERARRIRGGGPLVVLAHGGMIQERSPAFRCLKMVADDERNGVVANGYMDPCTPGGELFEHVHHHRGDTITLGDMEFTLHCSFEKVSLSAHAGGEEIEELVASARDQVIFVHGEKRRVKKHLGTGAIPNALFPPNRKEVVL